MGGFYTTDGCNGGFSQNAFAYDIAAGGIEPWTAYPFADMQTDCAYNSAESVASFSSCYDVTNGDEAVLEAGIAQIGPISVAIDAGLSSFHNYVSGIYYAPACSSEDLDHAVTAVGYGTLPESSTTISRTCTIDDFLCTRVEEGIEFHYPCFEQGPKAKKKTTYVVGKSCNPPESVAGKAFW